MKKVTAVVPIYNAEKYLDECIESIVNQTYKNLEIILVNDGSKDKSPQICDKWARKDNRITVIHKSNEGAGASRNRGINAATGDYIFFVDSDDYIAPTLVEKCLNAISDSDSAIVMFGTTNVTETGETINNIIPHSDKNIFENAEVQEELLPELLFSENKKVRNVQLIVCMAHFYSLSIIKKTNWKFKSEKEYLSEDLYSYLNLIPYITKFAIISESFYYYRHGHESLSASSRLTDYTMIRKYYEQCVDLCKKFNYNNKVLKNISEPYLSFTICCLKAKIREQITFCEKRKQINAILKDELLHKLIKERNLSNETFFRRILYLTILTKNYLLAWIFIYIQTYRSK